MARRARYAAAGALAGVMAMALTWYLAHHVAVVRQADADVLQGFLGLHRPRLNELTTAIASLCDPIPYVVLAVVPIAIALVRGRPRVALALALLLLGANETTQLLKPMLSGPRDAVAGVALTGSTWPSGHATASMSLALAMVIAVPGRLRPLVGALTAAFSVAVCWSLLELGWHYPSDVLGGYEVASVWALGTVALLWTYEAHRPTHARRAGAAGRPGRAGRRAGAGRPSGSLLSDLTAPIALAGVAGALALVLAAARPHAVLAYVAGHETFLVGAAGIGALALTCAAGLSAMLRRMPLQAPTAGQR